MLKKQSCINTVTFDTSSFITWENDISYSITKTQYAMEISNFGKMSVCRIGRNIKLRLSYIERIGQYFLYNEIHLSDCSPGRVSYPEPCHILQCIYITVSLIELLKSQKSFHSGNKHMYRDGTLKTNQTRLE